MFNVSGTSIACHTNVKHRSLSIPQRMGRSTYCQKVVAAILVLEVSSTKAIV